MTATAIISYPQALNILFDQVRRYQLESELIPLENACERVVAEDLCSPETLPAFANSAMDGFAVRSSDTVLASPDHPLSIAVLGQLAAGDIPIANESRHGAWEIMTGAPFPKGYDACVRLEDVHAITNASGHTEILLTRPIKKNENLRQIGEDFQAHSPLLSKGHRLRPEDILCLAALGIQKLFVFKRPRVAVISTGKELVSPAETPGPGQIRNSNGPFLMSALQKQGAQAYFAGTVADDPDSFQKLVLQLEKENYDLILTTGAVSMGKYDFVVKALQEIHCEFFFRKVAMRPGKPVVFGQLPSGCLLMGLPGNPISTAVGLRFFVVPLLRTLHKMAPESPLKLPLSHDTHKQPDAYCFLKGHLVQSERGSEVRLHKSQRPSLMHPLVESSLWVALPDDKEHFSQGDYVNIYFF